MPRSIPLKFVTLLTLLGAALFVRVSGQLAFTPLAASSCTATQRFDISGLTCTPCSGANQYADPMNPEQCLCTPGFQRVQTAPTTDSYALTCNDCIAAGRVALKDGSACTTCAAGISINPMTRDCACPPGKIIGP